MGSCATDKSDMPGRGVNLHNERDDFEDRVVEANNSMRGQSVAEHIKAITSSNKLLEEQLKQSEQRVTDLLGVIRVLAKEIKHG